MGVSVVLTRAVVSILAGGLVWCEFFQPDLIIMMKPAFFVVDEDGRGDVHGVDQTKAFADPAFAYESLNLRRDINESASGRNFKPKMFGQGFQSPKL